MKKTTTTKNKKQKKMSVSHIPCAAHEQEAVSRKFISIVLSLAYL